ncbi:site-specific integrase [uncultured Croceitalea sp.]|uniref:site-specific integrase n=1 Tax=uncultured Croceitalea sp. TaxID=1798908 RepID=UPI0033064F47
MAGSTRIVLRKKPNKQGKYPLVIRISKNRKVSYIYLGKYIDEKYWSENNGQLKKSCPNYAHLKNFLDTKLAEIGKTILSIQTNKEVVSARELKNQVVSRIQKKDFFQISDDYLNNLEEKNKLNQLSSDKARISNIRRFHSSTSLPLNEITVNYLKQLISFLKTNRKISERSIVNHLVVIRTIFNIAIKESIVDGRLYPFGSKGIKIRFPEVEKIGLNSHEVKNIENLSKLSPEEDHARNLWLFSFYFAGIRASDVLKLKWKDIYDGRLHYRMNKNSKVLSIIIPNKALSILKKYKTPEIREDDFIFPELQLANKKDAKDIWKKSKYGIKKTNRYLKLVAEKAKIQKHLTMHIARHSFGNIASDKISIQMLQKLYRHSSITTTMMYQSSFINKETDAALKSVVEF